MKRVLVELLSVASFSRSLLCEKLLLNFAPKIADVHFERCKKEENGRRKGQCFVSVHKTLGNYLDRISLGETMFRN